MIRNLENSEEQRRKQEVLGIFSIARGGSPIPKSICQNSYQKVNIFVKTKNAPNDLKYKINHTFFLETGVPKRGGGGGGGPTLGENSQKIPFIFLGSVPKRYFLGGSRLHDNL